MGRGFDMPYVEGSKYHRERVQHNMDNWFDIPWVRGSKYRGAEWVRYTIGKGFNIPLEGGQYTISSEFNIPWIVVRYSMGRGSNYHW
jgi:hypothetical protein